jgi:hypothetical protein
MKTIITTIAAAFLITLSLNALAQDTKKQEPVKNDPKTKTEAQNEPKTKTTPKDQPKPNTLSQPVTKSKTGTAKRQPLKRANVKMPQRSAETVPAKKVE